MKIKRSDLRNIIKESIKRYIKESNYDDYEYFYPDGTGGDDINPYPYGSKEARLSDASKEAQMASDWEDIDTAPADMGKNTDWKEYWGSDDKDAEMNFDHSRYGNKNIYETIKKSVKDALREMKYNSRRKY